ncbi:MAG: hypothetical protein SVX43_02650 [Cyanobacteriota bacterium]|nr:hypothetical protein [Cyanobacteriota bacterium]
MQAYKFLTSLTAGNSRRSKIFWFSLSMAFSFTFALIALRIAFSHNYMIQDDARQHVFWMWRFIDPQIYPDNLMADYFQSVAQPGYAALYRLASFVGIEPIIFNKILPPILGLIATAYCFGTVMQILPVPVAGFIGSAILNQSMWLKDDLISGTARAFLYPLVLAFFYYLLRRSLWPTLFVLLLLGLIYPLPLLICAGILVLRLFYWRDGRLGLSRQKSDYLFTGAGLGLIFLVLLPAVIGTSEYGPTVTVEQAREMAEFSEQGRNFFFVSNPIRYWLYAERSGFFPVEWSRLPYSYFPIMFAVGLLLPLLTRFPERFPLLKKMTSNVFLLPQLALVSTALFLAAHTLLFKLYLPSRYTQYSMRILMAISAGIVLTVVWDAVVRACAPRANSHFKAKPLVALVFTVFLSAVLLSYPIAVKANENYNFKRIFSYREGQHPKLYKFLKKQPKDILIASTVIQESSLSMSLAKRSLLVTREHSIAYHTAYYNEIRQRATDTIEAQYSPDLDTAKQFIEKYGIDFWLVDRDYLRSPRREVEKGKKSFGDRAYKWMMQFPGTAEAEKRAEQGIVPALARLVERCSVVEQRKLVVLEASCILEANGE